jgi:tetratricopeptide (TPR) repeat protein
MRRHWIVFAALLWVLPNVAPAAVAEPPADPPIDPAPCFSSIAANDDDGVIAKCAALIDHDKTARPDRIKALIARAGAYAHKDQIDRAIADDDLALRLDPMQADVFNARGELWRRKGDRPHALADFGAAIKLNPRHEAARANYKSLARELEQIGADMALKSKVTADCGAMTGPATRDRAILAGKCRPGVKP